MTDAGEPTSEARDTKKARTEFNPVRSRSEAAGVARSADWLREAVPMAAFHVERCHLPPMRMPLMVRAAPRPSCRMRSEREAGIAPWQRPRGTPHFRRGERSSCRPPEPLMASGPGRRDPGAALVEPASGALPLWARPLCSPSGIARGTADRTPDPRLSRRPRVPRETSRPHSVRTRARAHSARCSSISVTGAPAAASASSRSAWPATVSPCRQSTHPFVSR